MGALPEVLRGNEAAARAVRPAALQAIPLYPTRPRSPLLAAMAPAVQRGLPKADVVNAASDCAMAAAAAALAKAGGRPH